MNQQNIVPTLILGLILAVSAAAQMTVTGEVVEVGLNDFYIDMPTTLPAGPVTFLITNYGPSVHSFAIDGPGIDEALTHELAPGQQGAFTVELQPGTYSIICPVPGHRDNGMSLVLTVK